MSTMTENGRHWTTMAAGSVALIVGMFLGLTIAKR